jgi:hypothetical protein
MRRITLLPFLLAVACDSGEPASATDSGAGTDDGLPTLAPPDPSEGFQLMMQPVVVEPFSELWWCEVYDAPNTEYAAINRVEFLQNPGTHHMTLSTVTLGGTRLPEGQLDCTELYGDASLMEDQLMFFGNQDDAEGVMQLPDKTVADFPPALQIIHEVHYVNTTDAPVTLYSYVNAYTIDRDTVEARIWGGQVRDENLSIPAGGTATEWTRCEMNEDVEVIFLAGHMHEKGTRFTVKPWDGAESGEIFFDNDDWHNPKITQYDPPLVIPAGTGFEYACTWENPTDAEVTYGLTAEDEMCNLAVVFTPMSTTTLCEVVETSDGVLYTP